MMSRTQFQAVMLRKHGHLHQQLAHDTMSATTPITVLAPNIDPWRHLPWIFTSFAQSDLYMHVRTPYALQRTSLYYKADYFAVCNTALALVCTSIAYCDRGPAMQQM